MIKNEDPKVNGRGSGTAMFFRNQLMGHKKKKDFKSQLFDKKVSKNLEVRKLKNINREDSHQSHTTFKNQTNHPGDSKNRKLQNNRNLFRQFWEKFSSKIRTMTIINCKDTLPVCKTIFCWKQKMSKYLRFKKSKKVAQSQKIKEETKPFVCFDPFLRKILIYELAGFRIINSQYVAQISKN